MPPLQTFGDVTLWFLGFRYHNGPSACPMTRKDLWGATDGRFPHVSLFFTSPWVTATLIRVQSWILSCHLFFCLHFPNHLVQSVNNTRGQSKRLIEVSVRTQVLTVCLIELQSLETGYPKQLCAPAQWTPKSRLSKHLNA